MAVATRTMTGAAAPLAGRVHATTERAAARPAALPALTGLRIIPALGVVLCHFGHGATATALAGVPALAAPVLQLIDSGYMGVNVFFVLSGFILAYGYIRPDGRLRGTPRAFWAARIARIYPAYLLGLGLALGGLGLWGTAALSAPVYGAHLAAHPLGVVLATLGLVQSWVPYWGEILNPPAWSLSAEAFFYAVFPLAALLLGRLPGGRRGLLWALAGLWACALAVPTATLLGGAGHVTVWLAGVHPLARLPEFLCGVVAGRLYQVDRAAGRTPRHAGGLGLVACALLGLAFLATPLAPPAYLMAGLIDPLVVLLLYSLACGRGTIATVLAHPLLLVLGEASYALYILHWPLWIAWGHLRPAPAAGSAQSVVYVALYALLCVAASVLVLRLVETPGRRLLRAVLA